MVLCDDEIVDRMHRLENYVQAANVQPKHKKYPAIESVGSYIAITLFGKDISYRYNIQELLKAP